MTKTGMLMPPAPQANRPVDARCVRLLAKAESAAAVGPVVETHALSRGDNDVLIEVKAAAVNPSDVKAATAKMRLVQIADEIDWRWLGQLIVEQQHFRL